MGRAPQRIVIVGASAAGLTTAESLRADGYRGQITLIGAEQELPYDRPPLSKDVLAAVTGTPEPDLLLRAADRFGELDLDLHLGVRATGLDVAGHRVDLEDGSTLDYDTLVIATGVDPRPLDLGPGVVAHTLRTHDDAVRLRAAATSASRVLVIGAGVLGCEIAASLRHQGKPVTLTDRMAAPMLTALGHQAAAAMARLHDSHGVDLRLDVTLTDVSASLHDGGHLFTFSDGSTTPADCVVAAIGAQPNTGWLIDSGLDLSNGVICDDRLRAAPDVFAAGDVAAWRSEAGVVRRVEHRMNATEQGMLVARNIVGADEPFAPIPYFWSDQYDCKVQAYGDLQHSDDTRLVTGDLSTNRWVIAHGASGQLVGIVGSNSPRDMIRLRRQLLSGTDWADIG